MIIYDLKAIIDNFFYHPTADRINENISVIPSNQQLYEN